MDIEPKSHIIKEYWDIFVGFTSFVFAIFFHFEHLTVLAALFAAIGIGSLAVTISEIAEILAERFGEPFGSLVLTFSAVLVEILILFMVVLEAKHHPEVMETVKNGIAATVIVDLNALLGLAVFVGGLNFKEQVHNEDTSASYTTVLFVSVAMLLVPTTISFHADDQALHSASIIIAVLLFIYYFFIFRFQTDTHVHFFKFKKRSRVKRYIEEEDENYFFDKKSNLFNILFLIFLLVLIGMLSEIFANEGVKVFKQFGLTAGFVGILIAFVTAAPELFTAIRAAKNDEMQRVVNIAMGASTVSILLTVPSLIFLSLIVGVKFTLDFSPLQVGALLLTILLVWKTTENGETNYLEGLSHLMLFLSYAIIAIFY
ncbi:Ca2+:H+ antiporter [Lebetimonas natsushimae]|uniref:Ca2+:H+ antiporter n=1 Tax=Lebetimonas natsushimae TaxID=1936991 RepID=A0A292YGJ5_9BACT|nr:sodium:proton exchanger [Lebetimonas natsushimae]GAX88151.1 Ca2+:H+ antiporter [Lebetimonas natsushimae]